MADVFLADDERLGRQVAVKVLRRSFDDADEHLVQRFQVEARAAAMLAHPAIVAVFDQGQTGDHWYLVMEYVRGETLKQRLRREGALPVSTAVALLRPVLSALGAAHARDVIHRDVTSQNILLDERGGVKVADFGIARIGAPNLTRTGTMIGTCHYLSPEQAQGRAADARSDLYSAGVVLFETLTGRLPFEGDSEVAVALKHVQEPPPAPSSLVPGISPALDAVVLRALAKDPAGRFQTAAAFEQALATAGMASDCAQSGVPCGCDGRGGGDRRRGHKRHRRRRDQRPAARTADASDATGRRSFGPAATPVSPPDGARRPRRHRGAGGRRSRSLRVCRRRRGRAPGRGAERGPGEGRGARRRPAAGHAPRLRRRCPRGLCRASAAGAGRDRQGRPCRHLDQQGRAAHPGARPSRPGARRGATGARRGGPGRGRPQDALQQYRRGSRRPPAAAGPGRRWRGATRSGTG